MLFRSKDHRITGISDVFMGKRMNIPALRFWVLLTSLKFEANVNCVFIQNLL